MSHFKPAYDSLSHLVNWTSNANLHELSVVKNGLSAFHAVPSAWLLRGFAIALANPDYAKAWLAYIDEQMLENVNAQMADIIRACPAPKPKI